MGATSTSETLTPASFLYPNQHQHSSLPIVSSPPTDIRKRNGRVVPFDRSKIARAVRAAFFEVTGSPHDDQAQSVADQVLSVLTDRAVQSSEPLVPDVEGVQDMVEVAIMEMGFFDVAKAYIVYRFEHAKQREEAKEVAREKIERSELLVKKRDGRTELFSVEKIRKVLLRTTEGVEDAVDSDALIAQLEREVYDGIETSDIAQALVLVARSFIERDPAYSTVASRLLLQTVIYKDAIGTDTNGASDFKSQYMEAFERSIKEGLTLGLLDERLREFDITALARALKPERDNALKYLGTQTLYDRYFLRDRRTAEHYRILETPQFLWMRVAMGLALNERDKEARAVSFYEMLSTLRFVSSTPTLFHAGTAHPQLSSCYLGVVDDSLESIYKTYRDVAFMSKWAGGIGYSWSGLRASGAPIKTSGITSNGVVPFLKIQDSSVLAINRSGRRRGAACMYLETWHYDIEDFLELRKNTGDERRRTHDMNTANWIPDLFMKRVRDDGDWTLFSPDETPDLHETYGRAFEMAYERYERLADEGQMNVWKRVRARDLWKRMITQLFETGHPWVTFKDPSNIRSPQDHVGVVHSSNLCTEITLNTAPDEEVAVCNLGSVNLAEHLTADGVFDETKVRETVLVAMRMLDNVIDINFYPIPETRVSNMRHRPVGLGLMGFQDALYRQNIPFESEACVQFADYSMEVIARAAFFASSQLARERGAYESYRGSKWDRGIFPQDTLDELAAERGEEVPVPRDGALDWGEVRASVAQYGMRNSNCLAIAPTATIANIAGVFPSIEPIYKNIYVKANISGEFIVVNPYLVADLKSVGLWNHEMIELIKGQDGSIKDISAIPHWIQEKHREVFSIDPRWLVRAAAHRGKWIDQSQSLNIFYNGSSGKELSDLYLYAWQLGLKTTYYLRTLGASAIEKSTVELEKQQVQSTVEHARQEAAEAIERVRSAVTTEQTQVPKRGGYNETILAARHEDSVHEHHANSLVPSPEQEHTTVISSANLCMIDDPDCEACQ